MYSSHHVLMAKPKSMSWIGHVLHTKEKKSISKILVWVSQGRRSLQELDTDGKITLKWIFKKQSKIVDWVKLTQHMIIR